YYRLPTGKGLSSMQRDIVVADLLLDPGRAVVPETGHRQSQLSSSTFRFSLRYHFWRRSNPGLPDRRSPPSMLLAFGTRLITATRPQIREEIDLAMPARSASA